MYNVQNYSMNEIANTLIFGETHPDTIMKLQSQFENRPIILDQYKQYEQEFINNFNYFSNGNAINRARDIVLKYAPDSCSKTDYTNYVLPLITLENQQNASPVMQRWIMANPEIRSIYLKQRCDGYNETYTNLYGNKIGEEHYDYRRVMNGIGVEQENGDIDFVQYFDELVEGDRELTLLEQTDILNTWNTTNMILSLWEDDPTSSDGDKL